MARLRWQRLWPLLDWLGRLGMATPPQLAALASLTDPSHPRSWWERRLREARVAGLVQREWASRGGRRAAVYRLSPAGARVVAREWDDRGVIAHQERLSAEYHLEHELGVVDVIIGIVGRARELGVACLVPPRYGLRWQWGMGRRQVTPDAAVEVGGRWVAIEYDRSTRDPYHLQRQLEAYREAEAMAEAPPWVRGAVCYVLAGPDRRRRDLLLQAGAPLGERLIVAPLSGVGQVVDAVVAGVAA